jgi:hypothetical protein
VGAWAEAASGTAARSASAASRAVVTRVRMCGPMLVERPALP